MKKNTLLWLGLGALLLFSFKKKPTKRGSVFIPDTITQTEKEFLADRAFNAAAPIAQLIKSAVSFAKTKKEKEDAKKYVAEKYPKWKGWQPPKIDKKFVAPPSLSYQYFK